MKGRGKSIVADWVDRNLYYLEEQNNDVQNAIMKYDLNRKPETSDIVLVRPALILGFIQVSPKQRCELTYQLSQYIMPSECNSFNIIAN